MVGAIPSRRMSVQERGFVPQYKPSMWGQIERIIQESRRNLKVLQEAMPPVPEGVKGSDGADELVKTLLTEIGALRHQLRVWHKMGDEKMLHDQDDMRRCWSS